jgi:hypothetical protein
MTSIRRIAMITPCGSTTSANFQMGVRGVLTRDSSLLERVARVVFKRQAHRKLIKSLRSRLEAAMKYTTNKSQKARELVGCSLFELRQYLEKQFKPGMTWENHSYIGWHIDHIKPLAKFNLHDPEQQRIAFHFSNLQPLWAKENIAKGVS